LKSRLIDALLSAVSRALNEQGRRLPLSGRRRFPFYQVIRIFIRHEGTKKNRLNNFSYLRAFVVKSKLWTLTDSPNRLKKP
jgi:hypothetical protein